MKPRTKRRWNVAVSIESEGALKSEVKYEESVRLMLSCVLDRAHERTLKRGKNETVFLVSLASHVHTGHISDERHLPWKPIGPAVLGLRNINFKGGMLNNPIIVEFRVMHRCMKAMAHQGNVHVHVPLEGPACSIAPSPALPGRTSTQIWRYIRMRPTKGRFHTANCLLGCDSFASCAPHRLPCAGGSNIFCLQCPTRVSKVVRSNWLRSSFVLLFILAEFEGRL